MIDKLDLFLGTTARLVGFLIIFFTVLLLLGSLLPRRGSLDDLDAETIKRVVDGEKR